jgi:DNA replication initiation complex subunit (GINS family)
MRSIGRLRVATAGFGPVDGTRCCLLALVLALASGSFAARAGEIGGQTPAAPAVQQRDIKSLAEEKPVKPWKPGDPVRVMGDLREDGTPEPGKDATQPPDQSSSKPIVRGPVAPQVMEGSVDQLPKTKPYKEGDPVRVVPDLKESPPND